MDVILLCGGKSERMGTDKAALYIENETFLTRIIKNLSSDFYILLALGNHKPYSGINYPQIADHLSDKGPLAGIRAAMEQSNADTFFVVACDMPFVTAELARYLEERLDKNIDAVIPIDNEGRHPLAGIYRKSAYSAVITALSQKEYKVGCVLDKLMVKYVNISRNKLLSRQLININTPDDYDFFIKLYYTTHDIPVFAIVAYSGIGKTTFLEKLIPEFKIRGLRVAVVKHDAHDFDIDKEGKDSWRISKAGADMTGIISSTKAVIMENRTIDIKDFLNRIENVDIILIEGCKYENFPKIMLYRSDIKKPLPLEPSRCLAVVSDVDMQKNVQQFRFDDVHKVAQFILEMMRWR